MATSIKTPASGLASILRGLRDDDGSNDQDFSPEAPTEKSGSFIGGLAGALVGAVAGLPLGAIAGVTAAESGHGIRGGFTGAFSGALAGVLIGGLTGALVERKPPEKRLPDGEDEFIIEEEAPDADDETGEDTAEESDGADEPTPANETQDA